MKRLLLLTVPMLLICCGCQDLRSGNQVVTDAIEKTISEVVIPAAQNALQNAPSTLQTAANVQGVEPGYATEFEGFWVTGVKGKVTIYLKGVAGGLNIASQANPQQSVPTSGPSN